MAIRWPGQSEQGGWLGEESERLWVGEGSRSVGLNGLWEGLCVRCKPLEGFVRRSDIS